MSLEFVIKMGYVLMVGSIVLMIYASLTYAEDQTELSDNHPKCMFNPLCTCSSVFIELGHVNCKNVPLPRIPHQISESRVYFLQLQNNGLRHLQPYMFEKTNIFRMEISNNNLTDIDPDAFKGLEKTMRRLDLHSNHLTSVPSRAIKHLGKLQLLNLTDNEITDISPENWRGFEESLEILILRKNGISHLQPQVFSNLRRLQTLDLSSNALLELSHNVFHDGPPLVHLNLADNALDSIPYQELAYLRMLHLVDLSFNGISRLQNDEAGATRLALTLDTLRLDHNQITFIPKRAFENFRSINSTYLDGNPITMIQEEGFVGPRIRELYLRDCGIFELRPGAFAGLEPSLSVLDLSGNNLTRLPTHLFHGLDLLRTLSIRDNLIMGISPAETLNTSKYHITHLDLSGAQNAMVAIQELRGSRSLRSLTLSRLPNGNIGPEDFRDVSADLRELKISNGYLKTVRNNAFVHVPALEKLDLSENSITSLESDAFVKVGSSLIYVNLASAFSSSVTRVPSEAFKHLTEIQRLDISNNFIQQLPETAFHSMGNLQVLHMEDNLIEVLPKGTFQSGLHSKLEKIFLSFNKLSYISTHSFVEMQSLNTLRLDDNNLNRIEQRAFMNLDNLRYLSMRGNKLNQLASEAFQNLPALRELDLAYNELRSFDFTCLDQVGSMSPFKINVSHNNLRQLEDNSSFYTTDLARSGSTTYGTIADLDFSHNNITHIGKNFFRSIENSLTHLRLSHNSLRNLTRDTVGHMVHLQWLDVSHNLLSEIEFDALKHAEHIQIFLANNNKLEKLQHEVFRGLPLRIVDLSNNRLRQLPDMVFFKIGLEDLRVSGNMLTRLPINAMSSDAASSLIHLDVSNNAIDALHPPDSYGKFKSLQSLDLRQNRLIRLDDGAFSHLNSLFSVDLSSNLQLALDSRGFSFHGVEDTLQELRLKNLSINMVPEMHLPELRLLDLSDNNIIMIPQDLAQNLSSLRTLRVAGNALDAVPPFLPNFTQLRSLSLARNQISQMAVGHGLRLRDLDIRHLPLESFEAGALGKIPTLRSLAVSPSGRDLNLSELLKDNFLLERLHIEVWEKETGPTLGQAMNGHFPFKLREIHVSGRGIKSIPNNMLQGIQSPTLTLSLHNTTVEQISRTVFEMAKNVRSLKLDVRHNSMRKLANPNTALQPNVPRKMFLTDLKMDGNHWSCDCELGWVEGWERKKRQYFCKEARDSCRSLDDDLRMARCDNKQHQRMLEVLKNDIECGWNSAGQLEKITVLMVTFIAVAINRM